MHSIHQQTRLVESLPTLTSSRLYLVRTLLMAPHPPAQARAANRQRSTPDSAVAPKVNNLALVGGPSKSASPPAATPSTKAAAAVGPAVSAPRPTSAQRSKAASPVVPPPKSPSAQARTTAAADETVLAGTTTSKAKKVHPTTAVVPVLGGGEQQPVEAPAAVTYGSAPPTTLTDLKPSTVQKGALPLTTSVVVAGAGLASTSGMRSTGVAKQVPSLANPAGVNTNNNNFPQSSSSVIGPASANGRPHVNGTPTSTILAISVVLLLVVLAVIVVVVRRRLKAEERLVLGAGGRGGDGGGVKRGWKTLDEDGGGQFADDLKTDSALGGGGGGAEMVMSDGASFVWSGQGYRGAEVEERERERQEQERAYWAQQESAAYGYEDTARQASFNPPSPPRLYAAQMAPPPTRPPRPEAGPASSGVRNLYAPNVPLPIGRPERGPPAGPGPHQPSYSSASSLHPSHAVTHHPPVRTRSKTAAVGSGPAQRTAGPSHPRDPQPQGGLERASGSFSKLMMVGYDEEGSMVRSPSFLV